MAFFRETPNGPLFVLIHEPWLCLNFSYKETVLHAMPRYPIATSVGLNER